MIIDDCGDDNDDDCLDDNDISMVIKENNHFFSFIILFVV